MFQLTLRREITLLALIVGASVPATAQTATQTLTFQVDAINQIAFTGSPPMPC